MTNCDFRAMTVRRRSSMRHARGGYLLVAVLVAATVALGVSMAALRGTSTAIQRNRLQWRRVQLDRLVEASVWRAQDSFKRGTGPSIESSEDDDETWTVPGDALLSGGDAQISMQVDRDATPPLVTLSILWDHPDGPIRRETSFSIKPSPPTDNPQREES